VKTEAKTDLKEIIQKAADFHGHLGPFLVIGVRMGQLAKTNSNTEDKVLEAVARVPLFTPFSCVLDGIQFTTKCTAGNRKLKTENSQKEIAASFKLENSQNPLEVSVNQKTVEELIKKIAQGVSNEELAWKIAAIPENELFKKK
jgi:formylmethanofuran dehydrogenase subunit E